MESKNRIRTQKRVNIVLIIAYWALLAIELIYHYNGIGSQYRVNIFVINAVALVLGACLLGLIYKERCSQLSVSKDSKEDSPKVEPSKYHYAAELF